jgi:hypothetical protein
MELVNDLYWNYRIIKTKINEQDVYKIVEVYYNEENEIETWCDCTDTILMSDELDDLKYAAEHVLDAFKKPVLLHMPEENDKLIEIQ